MPPPSVLTTPSGGGLNAVRIDQFPAKPALEAGDKVMGLNAAKEPVGFDGQAVFDAANEAGTEAGTAVGEAAAIALLTPSFIATAPGMPIHDSTNPTNSQLLVR